MGTPPAAKGLSSLVHVPFSRTVRRRVTTVPAEAFDAFAEMVEGDFAATLALTLPALGLPALDAEFVLLLRRRRAGASVPPARRTAASSASVRLGTKISSNSKEPSDNGCL